MNAAARLPGQASAASGDRTVIADYTSRDPLWYKRAVFYEVNVRGFKDSNGDGTGDLRGLIEKLDYLKWLGVDCLWLLPLYESPLRDGGYDISDYFKILPEFGDLGDFVEMIEAAHKRGIRIITDLVMNHTSDRHPWFQASRQDPDGPFGDFYVWSDDPTRYAEAPVVFIGAEESNWTFDPVRGQYYWHRFFHHQPDLNYDNSAVQEAMLEVIRFWLDLGIDGFRLDAVPYLFERDGTNCAGLPETHAYLKRIRAEVDRLYPDKVLLAEANGWPEDVVAYFGDPATGGDECHMAFHFPLMPRLFMAVRRQNREPISEIMSRTPKIPEKAQWGIFLRNHDELTLEMVTEEERDYMHTEYAKDPRMRAYLGIRRRLAPLLDNDRDQIELFTALLLSMPGSPVLYYGDEIGMGDNIWLEDRDSVRTPMQWTPGPQRRVLHRRPRPALPAGRHGPGLRVPGGQRRGPDEEPLVVAALHPAHAADPARAPRVRHRQLHRAGPGEHERAGLPAGGRRGLRPLREQPLQVPAAGGAPPVPLPGVDPGRAAGRDQLPHHRRQAVRAHAAGVRVLLVPAPQAGRRRGRRPGRCPDRHRGRSVTAGG